MPRNRPVDYPQVHRPTAQPDYGLAPPRINFDDSESRFSWQVAGDEEQLDIGQITGSRIPPLPVLPGHLNEPVSLQKPQFRPDIPRYLQQSIVTEQHGPTPSYEASQAAYEELKTQDEPVYIADHDVPSLSAPTVPVGYVPEPQAEKFEQKSFQIGPDANPLSPTTPRSVTTTNIQTFPPPRPTEMHFDQPLSATQASHPSRGGTWQHSLFSCAEPTICLSSIFCPCVVYGRTQYRLSRISAHKDPTNMLGFSAVNKSCVAWSLLCGVNVLLTSIQRTRVRKAYEMEETAGSVVGDCMRSCFCCCCVVAQDEKEIRQREKGSVVEGYQKTEVMKFAVPS